MTSRRNYLASVASLGCTAVLAGCSLLDATGGSARVLGESAVAQRDARSVARDRSDEFEPSAFGITAIDQAALRSKLSAAQRRQRPLWALEEDAVDPISTYHNLEVEQSLSTGLARVRFSATAGDVVRERLAERHGLPDDPERRHGGFDCYDDANAGTELDELAQLAVSGDLLVEVGAAEVYPEDGATRRIDALDYAIGTATADEPAEGWIADVLSAASPAQDVRIDVTPGDPTSAQALAYDVRESEVVTTSVYARPTTSDFERAYGNASASELYSGADRANVTVEKRDRMAIARRTDPFESFFSDGDA